MTRRHSPAKKCEIVKLRKEGYTYAQIVKKLHCSQTTVLLALKNFGKPVEEPNPQLENVSNLLEELVRWIDRLQQEVDRLIRARPKPPQERKPLPNLANLGFSF